MKLVLVTNIPTPYRSAFFNQLELAAKRRSVSVHVVYCARSEPRRHWQLLQSDFEHGHSFVRGLSLRVQDLIFHFNPGIFVKLLMQRPTVVLCAGAWNMPSVWVAMLAAQLIGATCLFWSEGHAAAVRNSSGWIATLRRFILRRFDGFAVPNKASADWIATQRGHGARCILLPNTVDDSFYLRRDVGERARARVALGISDNLLIIVQISQLEPHKGVMQLAAAFLALHSNSSTPLLLVFVGEGSLRSELFILTQHAPAGKCVMLTGHIDRQRVRLWLMAADAFALNTFRDPNPLAPIEASFAELPLLLSLRAGNHPELVSKETGFSIEDCDSPGPALARLLATPIAKLRLMGANARQVAEAGFAPDKVAIQLLEDLEQLG